MAIITQTDKKHEIKFDNDGNPSDFTLVYDKKSTTVEPGHDITAQQVKDDPSILEDITKPDGSEPTPDDFIQTKDDEYHCPPRPIVERDPQDSYIDVIRIPREQVEISKTSKVSDNTVDQTSNIMSAAAKVDLSSEIEGSYDDYDEEDELLK